MLPSVATRLASSVDGETETSSRTPIATARADLGWLPKPVRRSRSALLKWWETTMERRSDA